MSLPFSCCCPAGVIHIFSVMLLSTWVIVISSPPARVLKGKEKKERVYRVSQTLFSQFIAFSSLPFHRHLLLFLPDQEFLPSFMVSCFTSSFRFFLPDLIPCRFLPDLKSLFFESQMHSLFCMASKSLLTSLLPPVQLLLSST